MSIRSLPGAAASPLIVLRVNTFALIASRQLVRGLTMGAVK